MDFEPSAKCRELSDRLEAFMAEAVLPAEPVWAEQMAASGDGHHHAQVVEDLKAEARARGLWNLFLPHATEWTEGLSNLDYAPLAEISGRSHLAPEALNCAAPDTGNMEVLTMFGTDEQKEQWLPGIADGSKIMAFAITEPDAGSNSHQITTTASPAPDGGFLLSGRKVFISGVDNADAIMVVGRTSSAEGYLRPALFIVPTADVEYKPIAMELVTTEKQFMVFLDEVALPESAIVGGADADLQQLFAGLNPERIMAAALSIGVGRYALARAAAYMKERSVWGTPIGAHQGLAHPLAQAAIEVDLAKLMMQKAAWLYDNGHDRAAGESANMAKYAAAEAAVRAVDQAVHSLGGNGMTVEYGLAHLVNVARVGRIAPVSREMILNFVAQQKLGLPRSY
jgi:alkylation response protein AidB-like acyl-CoA dehydrogenase